MKKERKPVSKKKVIIFIVAIILFAVFIVPLLSFGFYAATVVSSMLFSTVEEPEIQFQEFNITIEYEYAGEEHVLHDVLVCEYDESSWSIEGGRSREWKSYIKSTGQSDILLEEFDHGTLYIYCYLDPRYMMGDPDWQYYHTEEPYVPYDPDVFFVPQDENDFTYVNMTQEERNEHFGFRLIGWSYDPPIENTFH